MPAIDTIPAIIHKSNICFALEKFGQEFSKFFYKNPI